MNADETLAHLDAGGKITSAEMATWIMDMADQGRATIAKVFPCCRRPVGRIYEFRHMHLLWVTGHKRVDALDPKRQPPLAGVLHVPWNPATLATMVLAITRCPRCGCGWHFLPDGVSDVVAVKGEPPQGGVVA